MLVTEPKAIGILFAVLLQPICCRATTIVAIVSPHGIAVSADSKVTAHTGDFSPLPSYSETKLFLVQDRIVIATIGISDIGDGGVHWYSSTWIKNLVARLPQGVSVDDLATRVQTEIAKVFATFDVVLKTETLKQKNPTENCRTFFQFVIAGYQDGVPRILVVQSYIDWDAKRLVGPKQILLHPVAEPAGNFAFYEFGIFEALTDILDRHSYAYKQALARSKAFGSLLKHRDISLNDTGTLSRLLIRIEEEVNPSEVGGDIATVTILPAGGAHREMHGANLSHTRHATQQKGR